MSVSATVEADQDAGRGYARLTITGDVPEGFAPLFLIRRPGSNLEHLGSDGWQTAEHSWHPAKTEFGDHRLVLFVGPDLVRHMENGNYRLVLFDAARTQSLTAPLTWRDIPQPADIEPLRTGLRRGRGEVAIRTPSVTTLPRPGTSIDGGGPDEHAKQEAVEKQPDNKTNADTITKEFEEKALAEDVVVPPQPTPQRWRVYAAIGAVVLLMLGGGYYFWKLDNIRPTVETEKKTTPPPDERTANKDDKSAKPAVTGTPLEQARAALKDPALSTSSAVTLAQQLGGLPNGADAAFLLLDYAAEKGDGNAALALGRYFDPSSTAPSGSIKKDGMQAAKYYRQAMAKGVPDATTKLEALRSWVKRESAQGNAEAAKLAETLQ